MSQTPIPGAAAAPSRLKPIPAAVLAALNDPERPPVPLDLYLAGPVIVMTVADAPPVLMTAYEADSLGAGLMAAADRARGERS